MLIERLQGTRTQTPKKSATSSPKNAPVKHSRPPLERVIINEPVAPQKADVLKVPKEKGKDHMEEANSQASPVSTPSRQPDDYSNFSSPPYDQLDSFSRRAEGVLNEFIGAGPSGENLSKWVQEEEELEPLITQLDATTTQAQTAPISIEVEEEMMIDQPSSRIDKTTIKTQLATAVAETTNESAKKNTIEPAEPVAKKISKAETHKSPKTASVKETEPVVSKSTKSIPT